MRPRCLIALLLVSALLGPPRSMAQERGRNVLRLDDMKTIEKWSHGNIEQGTERGGTLKWTLAPGDKVQMTAISLAPFKIDPKGYDRLKLDYKIEGPCRWFGVKVQHYLLQDSRQMVYRAFGPGEGSGKWEEASLAVSRPESVWENEGGRKLESLSLRAQPAKEGQCVIQVKNLRLVRSAVKKSVREVVGTPTETRYEIVLKNVEAGPHEVALSLDGSALSAFAGSLTAEHVKIEPNSSATVTVSLALKPNEKRSPLHSEKAHVKVAVEDEAESEEGFELSATVPLPKLSRPFVFTTKEQIANAKENIERYPWAKKIYDDLIKRGDGLLTAPIEIPDRTGSWSHYYACAECGCRLKTIKPTEHKCTGCGKVYSGDPYDAVIVAHEHSKWARNARDLGLAYAFTDKIDYARRSAEIFKEYERKYRTYTPQTHTGKIGAGWKVISYCLGQSVWAIPVAQGYDFIRDAGVLTDEEKKRIEDDFLRDVARSVQGHRGVHNITCWRNAAVGSIGLAIGDREMVRWAIEDQAGLKNEIAEGILEDGFWFEGSWGYHFYALSPLCSLAESAHHVGIDVFDGQFEKMFAAPIRFMTADRWLPAFNDSGSGSHVGADWRYVLAAKHYPDSTEIAWLVSQALGENKIRDVESLLYFPEQIAKVDAPPMKTCLFKGSGIVILRSLSDVAPLYVAFEYGPHGGGHGHPDKLGFVLCALGKELAPDPGSISYAVPLHKQWYRQTLSHNTLTVDRESQQPTTGELLYMGSSPEFQIAACRTTGAYPGVSFERTMAIVANECLLVLDDVQSDKERLYDIAYHIRGEVRTDLDLQPPAAPVGEGNGYDILENVKSGKGRGLIAADFAVQSEQPMGVHMLTAGAEGADVITALGRGNPPSERVPCLILRRRAKDARYASILEPFKERARVKSITLHPVVGPDGAVDKAAVGVIIESENWRAAGILAASKARRSCPDARLEADAKTSLVLWQNGGIKGALVVDGDGVSVDGKTAVSTQQ